MIYKVDQKLIFVTPGAGFYILDALPVIQLAPSKHWREDVAIEFQFCLWVSACCACCMFAVCSGTSLSSTRQHMSNDDCLEDERKIIITVLCCRDGTGSWFLTRDQTPPSGFWPGDPTLPDLIWSLSVVKQILNNVLIAVSVTCRET